MKRTQWVVYVALLLICSVSGFLYGTYYGQKLGFRMMRSQTRADLEVSRENGNKELSEYLKARYYYYSNRAGLRFRSQEGDLGPIDASLLQGFSAGKGPTSWKEEYDDYQRALPK